MKETSEKSVKAVVILAGMLTLGAVSSVLYAANSEYRYDSLGRLRKVCNQMPAQGYRTDYGLDAADNRTAYRNTKTDVLLGSDMAIFSPDGRFQFRMQSDGNLVLYQNNPVVGLWGSGTAGSGANVAAFQSDGNLVLYRADGSSPWHSNTYMYPCAKLEVQNDGNVVIRNLDDAVVWQTNTGGH